MKSKIFKPALLAGILALIFTSCTTDTDPIDDSGQVGSISTSFEENEVIADFLIDAKPAVLKVRFESTSSGASSYKWSFPGGSPSSSSSEVPPIVEYPVAGEYTVTLEVSDGTNSDTHSSTIQL